jgi:hypothetical protein
MQEIKDPFDPGGRNKLTLSLSLDILAENSGRSSVERDEGK